MSCLFNIKHGLVPCDTEITTKATSNRRETQFDLGYMIWFWFSVKLWQTKEMRIKFLHATKSKCGFLGKAGVKVGVRNHHHLHPRS